MLSHLVCFHRNELDLNHDAAGGSNSVFPIPSLGRTSDSHGAGQLPLAHVPAKSLAYPEKTSRTSEVQPEPLSPTRKRGRNINLVPENNCSTNTISAEINSSPHIQGGSAENVGSIVQEELSNSSCAPKKLRTSGWNTLNSLPSQTLEHAVLGLEELANKIKCLKGLLGVRIPLSGAVKDSWRFIEHRAPSLPK